MQRALDLPHQVGQEHEAPLQEPQDEQLAFRISGRDLPAEFPDPLGDCRLIEGDSLDGPPLETGVGDDSCHPFNI
ncbi:hypothetical protein D3C83_89770 [compost metagenome]